MRIIVLLFISVVLTACATNPVPPLEQRPAKPAEAEVLSPRAQIYYAILLGEIALQHQDLELALRQYTLAANLSQHPLVIRRAVQIAIYSHHYEQALKLSQMWVQVAPNDMEAHRTTGLLYLQLKQPDAAMVHLYYLIDHSTDPGTTSRALSQLLLNEPDARMSLSVLQRLARHYPNNLPVRLAQAQIYFRQHELDQAQSLLNGILKASPKYTEALQLQGLLYREQEKRALARDFFLRAAQSRPADAGLWQAYASLLVEYGDIGGALKVYRHIQTLKPHDSSIRFAVAMLMMEDKRYDEAQKVLLSLTSDPQFANSARYFLGYLAEVDNDLEGARNWYQQVVAGEDYPAARIRLGFVLLKLQRFEDAEHLLRQLKKDKPKQSSIQLDMTLLEGELLAQQGKLQKAYRVYSKALQATPEQPDLLYARAMLADKLGRLDWLERDLRRILDSEPDNVQALNALGYTLADKTQRFDEAYALIQKALKLAPGEPAIMDSMGWVLYRMGRYEEAVAWLKKASAKSPDEVILAHLIEALWYAGQHNEARQAWQQASQRYPDSPLLKSLEQLWQ